MKVAFGVSIPRSNKRVSGVPSVPPQPDPPPPQRHENSLSWRGEEVEMWNNDILTWR